VAVAVTAGVALGVDQPPPTAVAPITGMAVFALRAVAVEVGGEAVAPGPVIGPVVGCDNGRGVADDGTTAAPVVVGVAGGTTGAAAVPVASACVAVPVAVSRGRDVLLGVAVALGIVVVVAVPLGIDVGDSVGVGDGESVEVGDGETGVVPDTDSLATKASSHDQTVCPSHALGP